MNTMLDIEELYDNMAESVERAEFENQVEALVETGYLEKSLDSDDNAYFRAKSGLTWSYAVRIACPVKKQILLCLMENPKTFFVIYNTQKGKLRIAGEEIRSWAGKRVVAFLMVDNDKTLADQSSDGVRAIVEDVGDIFLLSSNSGDKLEDIKNKIDSYAAFGGKMPVIVALNNGKQVDKIVKLMEHVKMRMEMGGAMSELRYGIVFDEADRIYPPVREKFSKLLVTDDSALHRLGFVSATEGDLMDADYPECANAYMHPVPLGNPDYRAIHHNEAVVKHVVHRVKDGNDAYAEAILESNKEYFKKSIQLKDGSMGFRKVIVNGGAKRASMESFATRRTTEGAYAITVNMNGVVVYRAGYDKKKYSAKGIRFGELLFRIYKELGLHDKPLYVIGRRKVDRGLGFHFAPRDGSEGLVWTDMILGRVDDKNTAVQKAGRLAGVVAHCPQYPGKLTWWTDEKTASMVCRHNDVVDSANTKAGCSALQAMTRAKVDVPEEIVQSNVDETNFQDEWREFSSFEDAKKWGKNIRPKTKDVNGFELSSTTGKPRVLLVDDILSLKRGKKTSAMPTDHKKKGDVRDRLFVVYSNENDPTSGCWVVHRLTRITDVV
jgi:hypothetical protein